MSDATSPIIEFYPTEFEQDMNGKRAEWEAVVKIPFIDIVRLRTALACAYFIFLEFASDGLCSEGACPHAGRTRAEYDIWCRAHFHSAQRW